MYFSSGLCDTKVSDGLLDGDATCKQPQSDIIRSQMRFKNGALDGDLKLYDFTPASNIVSTANFSNGRLDKKLELYSIASHKIIGRSNWDKGVITGLEEVFDENTGNRILSVNYVGGKTEGEMLRFAPDGKRVIYRANAINGLKNGVEEEFDQTTGKQILSAQWSNGKKDGPFKQWDAAGNVVTNKNYKDDVELVTSTPATSNIDACVDAWIAAFRHEQGSDAMVTNDQLGEWQSWCKDGKKPN